MSIAERNSEAAAKWAAKRRQSQERAVLLQDRPTATASRRRGYREAKPLRNAASTSHEANAAYMRDFRQGLAGMYLSLEGKGPAEVEAGDEFGVKEERSDPYLGRTAAEVGGPFVNQHGKSAPERIRRGESEESRSGKNAQGISLLAGELKNNPTFVAAASGWRDGPLDPAGQVSGRQGIGYLVRE